MFKSVFFTYCRTMAPALLEFLSAKANRARACNGHSQQLRVFQDAKHLNTEQALEAYTFRLSKQIKICAACDPEKASKPQAGSVHGSPCDMNCHGQSVVE